MLSEAIMTPERWARVKELFQAAVELAEKDRGAFLEQRCGTDPELLRQVAELLRRHRPEDRAATEADVRTDSVDDPCEESPRGLDSASEKAGDWVGRYKLLQKIGEGGMGVVYMAEQIEPFERRVALKIIKLGMDTKNVIARFEAERQALAMMDHPNIAQVFDAGTTATGRSYFVMELVRGIPITTYCNTNNLSTQERMRLFIQVCHAIQHAHQKGIIHRDIKPSNILVTLHDGVPVPKVIDFGIAKATQGRLTNQTLFTAFEQFIGTPAYMSPEQAEMSGLDIDTRSDIYSLGVLLYELLTGRTPFDSEELLKIGLDAMRQRIREEEPPKPSTRLSTMAGEALTTAARQRHTDPTRLIRSILGDLDWIVMKCLEKDRTRRFITANELALDLERHLCHEPVVARPPSGIYRLRKLVQRNKLVFAVGTTAAAALMLGFLVSTWEFFAERQSRHEADRARREAEVAQVNLERQDREVRQNLYFSQMDLAGPAATASAIRRVDQLLTPSREGQPDLRGWEWYYLDGIAHQDLLTLHGHIGPVHTVAWNLDDSQIVSAGADGTIRIWDAWSGIQLVSIHVDGKAVRTVAWNSQTAEVASGGTDGVIRLWDPTTGRQLRSWTGHTGPINSVAWSRDGSRLASGGTDDLLKIWDGASGKALLTISAGSELLLQGAPPLRGATASVPRGVNSVVWDPAGKRIATTNVKSRDWLGTIKIWDAVTGAETIRPIPVAVNSVAWSPDGKYLVSGRADWSIQIWNASTGNASTGNGGQGFGDGAGIFSVDWNPQTNQLAVGEGNNTVVLWDVLADFSNVPNRVDPKVIRGHCGEVNAVVWSHDGTHLASGSQDGTVKIWVPFTQILPLQMPYAPAISFWVNAVAWSPDGQFLASGGADNTIKIFDKTGRTINTVRGLKGQVRTLAWNPRGRELASGSSDGVVKLWNDVTGSQELSSKELPENSGIGLAWRPDGSLLASAGADHQIRLWNPKTLEPLQTLFGHAARVQALCWNPDGTRLVSADEDGVCKIWDVTGERTANERLTFREHVTRGGAMAWSPDGRLIACGGAEQSLRIWDALSGKLLMTLYGHNSAVTAVAWHPDSCRLATVSWDGSLRLWDISSGKQVCPLPGPSDLLTTVSWSNDGMRLATGGRHSTIYVCDASVGYLYERARIMLPFLDQRLAEHPTDLTSLEQRAEVLARSGEWEKSSIDIRRCFSLDEHSDYRVMEVARWISVPDLVGPPLVVSSEKESELVRSVFVPSRWQLPPLLNWAGIATDPNGYTRIAPTTQQAAASPVYVLMRVYASEEQNTTMNLASTNAIHVWLNGTVVYDRSSDRNPADGQEPVTAHLGAGWNTILARVAQHEDEGSLYLQFSQGPSKISPTQ
jgi:eukaryotic-like serine/threonine-protein kinase